MRGAYTQSIPPLNAIFTYQAAQQIRTDIFRYARFLHLMLQFELGNMTVSQQEKIALNGFRFRRGPDGKPVPYRPPNLTGLKASPLAGPVTLGYLRYV